MFLTHVNGVIVTARCPAHPTAESGRNRVVLCPIQSLHKTANCASDGSIVRHCEHLHGDLRKMGFHCMSNCHLKIGKMMISQMTKFGSDSTEIEHDIRTLHSPNHAAFCRLLTVWKGFTDPDSPISISTMNRLKRSYRLPMLIRQFGPSIDRSLPVATFCDRALTKLGCG